MRYFALLIPLTLLLGAGCPKKKSHPEFDKKFEKAKKANGIDKVQVITSKGSLKGNVQRLRDPEPPAGFATKNRVYLTLSQNLVARYIRRQVARLSSCQRKTGGKAGKVLISVTIQSTGRVSSASVEAPDFAGTGLAGCLEQGAKRWKFPRFKLNKPLTYSYPLIFR